jgi:hypothetical protein
MDNNILKTHDKNDAFRKKLRLWKARCQDGVFDRFPLLSCVVDETTMKTDTVIKTISNHLQNLSSYFYQYFGDDDFTNFDWIRNSFECELTDLTGREQDELAELSSDRSLRLQFSAKPLFFFLGHVRKGISRTVRQSSERPSVISDNLCVHFLHQQQ